MFLNYVYLGTIVLVVLLAVHPPFRKSFADVYGTGSAKFGIIPAILAAVLVFGVMLLVWPVPAAVYLKGRVS